MTDDRAQPPPVGTAAGRCRLPGRPHGRRRRPSPGRPPLCRHRIRRLGIYLPAHPRIPLSSARPRRLRRLRPDAPALYRLHRLHQLQRRASALPRAGPRMVCTGPICPARRPLRLPPPPVRRARPVPGRGCGAAQTGGIRLGRNVPAHRQRPRRRIRQPPDGFPPLHTGRSRRRPARHPRAQHRAARRRAAGHSRGYCRPPLAECSALHLPRLARPPAPRQPPRPRLPPAPVAARRRTACQRRDRPDACPGSRPRQLRGRTDRRTRRPRLARMDRHAEFPPAVHRPRHSAGPSSRSSPGTSPSPSCPSS